MTVIRWILAICAIGVLIVFCVIGNRINHDITEPLKSARRCYTSGEAICYLQKASDQLDKRGWDEEVDQVQGLITQLSNHSTYSIDLRFSEAKDVLWTMTEWQGEGFPMPKMSHFHLIDKYRGGIWMWTIFWASVILFCLSFRKELTPPEEIIEASPRPFGYYTK